MNNIVLVFRDMNHSNYYTFSGKKKGIIIIII